MRLNTLDVVEVRLPVLHDAILIGRNKPFVVVRISCCSESTIVCLHDSLEVEASSIPKSELATSTTSEETSAFGGPLDDVHWVLDLVQGRVKVTGGNGVDRAISASGRWQHVKNIAETVSFCLEASHPLMFGPSVLEVSHIRRADVCSVSPAWSSPYSGRFEAAMVRLISTIHGGDEDLKSRVEVRLGSILQAGPEYSRVQNNAKGQSLIE